MFGSPAGTDQAAGACWIPMLLPAGPEPGAGSALLRTFTSTAPENWSLPFHGPGSQHADRHSLRFPEELHSHGDPMGSAYRSLSQACVPRVTALCITDRAPSHQLAVGQCPNASLVGLQAPGDRVLHGMLAPSTVTNCQVGPCWVCQPEDALWGPDWPCGGTVAGAYMERVLERKKTEHPKSEVWSMPSREFISSSHQRVMACHLIITAHNPSSSFSPGIKGLMFLSAFLETALSHQQKAGTPWVSG